MDRKDLKELNNFLERPSDEEIESALDIIQKTCQSVGPIANCYKCPLYSAEQEDCALGYISELSINRLGEKQLHRFFD